MTARAEHTITYQNGLLKIRPTRIKFSGVCIISSILVTVPLIASAILPIAQLLVVTVIWSAAIGYLSIGRMRLQSVITVDIKQRVINYDPLYPALFRKGGMVSFSSIKSLNLSPIIVGGRYTPLGRRLRLLLNDKSKITLLDCANYHDAEKVYKVITAIVHPSSATVKNLDFNGKDILVFELAREEMDYIVYQSVIDGGRYYVNILKNVGSSQYSVTKLLKSSDAINLLKANHEIAGRIVDSYR